MMLVMAAGVKKSLVFNNVLNALNLSVWVFVMTAGLFYVDTSNWSEHKGFLPNGWPGVSGCRCNNVVVMDTLKTALCPGLVAMATMMGHCVVSRCHDYSHEGTVFWYACLGYPHGDTVFFLVAMAALTEAQSSVSLLRLLLRYAFCAGADRGCNLLLCFHRVRHYRHNRGGGQQP